MRAKRLCCLCLGLLLCCLLCACRSSTEADAPPDLSLICLDVGQGSSTLLRTKEGDILIDAGTEASEEALCLRLRALGVEMLSLLILTHADEDHIGGADGILRSFAVERVWTNGTAEQHESYRRLLGVLQERSISAESVQAGSGTTLGGVTLTVLAPLPDSEQAGNEGSLVLLASHGTLASLWMGDAGVETERTMLAAYSPEILRAQLLFVGHHGSDTASSTEFLAAVQPELAVISCGAGNLYGHPDGRALARIEQAGARILRTDLLGEIVLQARNGALRLADEYIGELSKDKKEKEE